MSSTRLTNREVVSSTSEHLQELNQMTSKGVIYVEEDTGRMVLGDGVRNYNDIPSNILSASDANFLSHWRYDENTRKLVADRAVETTLNSLYLGEQHKMSSGAENIFFTNLGNDTNFYPMWGGLKDQSITANQDHTGFIPPSGRVYTDMFSLPLGGSPDPLTSVGYSGPNYFGVSIAGLGITTTAAETIPETVRLEYRLSVNGKQVYMQVLPRNAPRSSAGEVIYPGDVIEWFFDHPVEIHAGTTIYAEIRCVREADDVDLGIFQVRQGDTVDPNTGLYRYQAIVHNRLFTDKDLELISPYIKYTAMDFGLDDTGSSILFRDLSLATGEELLIPHPINSVEAVASGTNIQIKVKGGAKILIEALPVTGASINGSLVNAVLNQAVVQLNDLFTSTEAFTADTSNPVTTFALSGDNLTLGLEDGTSYTVDVTTLGVDENNFVASGALSGSDLVLTMTDSTTVTIDASNMINGSTLPAQSAGWYVSSTDALVTSNKVNNTIRNIQPFYNGTLLDKGTEFLFNNEDVYGFSFGVYDPQGANPTNGTDGQDGTNWLTMFRFNNISGVKTWSASDSQSIDLASDHTMADSTGPMLLRYTSDNYLKLIELAPNGDETLIATSTTQQVGDSLSISWVGYSAGSVFPTFIKRSENWTIVHDFDNSENGIYNNIEAHTVIRSNIQLAQGEKYMINLTADGRNNYFGTDYVLASTGNATAEADLDNRFTYGISEQLTSASDWTLNTSAAHYDATIGTGGWRANGNGNPVGMVSMRYQNNNVLELWSEEQQELIMTCNAAMDGNPIHLYYGVREGTVYSHLPTVTKQTIGQGIQPITTYAPNVPDQVFYIEENGTLNAQLIAMDYIVNQWVEIDAPNWITMNQNTGVLSGTAPAFTNSSADAIVINCKAANAVGGATNFTATVNVYQATYTNSNSIRFDAGHNSYFSGNSANVSVLQRTGNPAIGSTSDAWTISMWVKRGDNTGNPYFAYGSSNGTDGYIEIRETADDRLRVRYGTSSNYLQTSSANNTLTNGWNHIVVVYTGGPTGNYEFGNLKTYINGALMTLTHSSGSSSGFSGNIGTGFMYVGRFSNTYLDNGHVDQLVIWGSDKSADISSLYNSGTPQNLDWSNPAHYYEFGDSIVTATDRDGNANLSGFNLNTNDMVTDTP